MKNREFGWIPEQRFRYWAHCWTLWPVVCPRIQLKNQMQAKSTKIQKMEIEFEKQFFSVLRSNFFMFWNLIICWYSLSSSESKILTVEVVSQTQCKNQYFEKDCCSRQMKNQELRVNFGPKLSLLSALLDILGSNTS